MPAATTAASHRSFESPHYPDTKASPSGKLGDRRFDAQDPGDTGRAAKSWKPTPAERTLLLVGSQEAVRTASRPPALSIASTPDSGVAPSSHKTTPSNSITDDLDGADSVFSWSSADTNAFNGRHYVRSDSLTPLDDSASLQAKGPHQSSDASSVDSDALNPFNDASSVNSDVRHQLDDAASLDSYDSPEHSDPLETCDVTGPPAPRASSRAGDARVSLAANAAHPAPPPTTPDTHTAASLAHQEADVPLASVASRHRNPTAPSLPRSTASGNTMPAAAVMVTPDQHPDVRIAIEALQAALAPAAELAPELSQKPTKPTGAAPLRAIARAQRHTPDALHRRALDFYKALIALPRNGYSASTQKQAAIMLAALAQRAAAEGYEATEQDLIQRVLKPMLHSLPFETLCELGRLNDSNDGMGDKILRDAGKLLGADKRSLTPKVAQARREHQVASTLLGVIAELCREHARAASWDRQVASALEAARNGQHQQLDAALREMWQGDLLTGEIDRPRVNRLMDLVTRLSADQQYALATMLGVADRADVTTATFDDFKSHHLAEYERDKTIHRQMLGFIDHLRAASRTTVRGGANTGSDLGTSLGHNAGPNPGADMRQSQAQSGADAATYPEPIMPRASLKSTFQRFRHSVASTFRRKPTTRDAAKAEINQAVRMLIEGDRFTASQLESLQSVSKQLSGKLGQSKGTAFQRVLIQAQLSKLASGQLAQLDINLASARRDLRSSPVKDPTLEKFYGMLHERLEREAGIRRGAAALAQVLTAMPQTRHPEELLDALDVLADAQYHALSHQSELDFYAEALGRLGETARATLQKRLKGREDVQRYMRGVHEEIGYAPAAWLQYRHSQLDTLSRAGHAMP